MKYKALIKVLGLEKEATGETIEEALANLGLEWNHIKSKGTITISKGKESHEHLFNMKILRRIMVNDIVRNFWAKNFGMYLKDGKKSNIPE